MKISLNSAGKKYYREWIFRKTNLSFSTGQNTVILGPNGSGKSTLLQVIAGAVIPNEGSITYHDGMKEILADNIFNSVSFASPYLELIEEFNLIEIIRFHFKFKKSKGTFTESEILEITGLNKRSNQPFKYFSSGMKQKVKLALAFLSDTSILLLDEPCSNLDKNGVEWYQQMIKLYSSDRIIIVASNQNEEEYDFCESKLNMIDFKS